MTEQPAAAPAPPAATPDPRRGRQRAIVVLTGVAGAALVAIAAALTWWSADYVDPLTGPLTVKLSGGTCVPELIPLTLVGLAGVGAALATGGVPRRLVGLVLLAAGVTVTVRSALAFGSAPTALAGSLTRPADLVGTAQLHPTGPALAVLGGLLLSAAGVLVMLGVGARRLGARYERTSPTAAARAGDDRDPPLEQGDWWKALDAGADPTATGTGTGTHALTSAGTAPDSDGGPRDAPSGPTAAIPTTDRDHDGIARSASDARPEPGTEEESPSPARSVTASGSNSPRPDTAGGSPEGCVSEQTSEAGYDDPQASSRT